jgi:predicted HAD superfamily Cof-like phosphohydrolase
MNEACAAVGEFMVLIGTAGNQPDKNTAALRIGLILEEWHETDAAMRAGDAIEAADGLADLLYVIVGTAVTYDILLSDVFPAYDERQADDRAPRNPDSTDALRLAWTVVDPFHDLTTELVKKNQSSDTLRLALSSLTLAVATAAYRLNWPLRELFFEVHRSNMTKGAGQAASGGDVLKRGSKGSGFQPPNIAGVLKAAGWLGSSS